MVHLKLKYFSKEKNDFRFMKRIEFVIFFDLEIGFDFFFGIPGFEVFIKP